MARIPHSNDGLADELREFFDSGRMTCPHCGQQAKPQAMYAAEARSIDPISLVSGTVSEVHPIYKLAPEPIAITTAFE